MGAGVCVVEVVSWPCTLSSFGLAVGGKGVLVPVVGLGKARGSPGEVCIPVGTLVALTGETNEVR